MLTKEEFITQNIFSTDTSQEIIDDLYNRYVAEYQEQERRRILDDRLYACTKMDWNLIGKIIPLICNDYKKEFYEKFYSDDSIIIKIEKEAHKIIVEEKIAELYEKMNQEVLDGMKVAFGTSNEQSANAYYQTWKLMLENPNLFVGRLNFTDEQQVKDYGQSGIDRANEYAIVRMEKIASFKSQRDALLASLI